MKLYHYSFFLVLIIGLTLVGAACGAPQLSAPRKQINLTVEDGASEYSIEIPAGSTVQDGLDAAGLTLEGKDRVEPAASTILEEDALVRVIRVEEEYETVEQVIPYQVIRQPTENLPEGEEQLLQAGKNGLEEASYLRVLENGEEVSYEQINRVIVEEPVDEIILIGRQAPIGSVNLPGSLVYLSDGNAWKMENSSSNRSLVVATGDLDGRIFKLSDNGEWLLFTRKADEEGVINTLWAANISGEEQELIDLEVSNVIHFADWVPGSVQEVVYSTVESRVAAPGWQANNDLVIKRFSLTGWTEVSEVIQETNYGGVYGWWGTDFEYIRDGSSVVYSSPDQVGVIDIESGEKRTLLDLIPYNTRGDWAWMPGLGIGPRGKVLYTVQHADDPESESAEGSPYFDLVAIPLESGFAIKLKENVGMFAYPLPSPLVEKRAGETGFQLAFLQAALPEMSETSSYRIAVMDRDGSNQRVIFPSLDMSGLEPRRGWGAWGPRPSSAQEGYPLAVLYQNNIWILDPDAGEANQVTGDGRVQRLDW